MIILIILLSILCIRPVNAEKVRVVEMADGTISVIVAADPNNTLEAFEKAMETDPDKTGRPYQDIEREDLPPLEDWKYWKKKAGGGLEVNVAKKNVIRQKEDQEEQDRKVAIDKLKALGLTENEINTLIK